MAADNEALRHQILENVAVGLVNGLNIVKHDRAVSQLVDTDRRLYEVVVDFDLLDVWGFQRIIDVERRKQVNLSRVLVETGHARYLLEPLVRPVRLAATAR